MTLHLPPSRLADQFVLRFEREGHRDLLKIEAVKAKRSLNKHILHLVEAGEQAESQRRGATA